MIKVDTSIAQPSILYLSSEYYYRTGYTLTVIDKDGKTVAASSYKITDIKHNYIGVQITNAQYNGQLITFKAAANKVAEGEENSFMQ